MPKKSLTVLTVSLFLMIFFGQQVLCFPYDVSPPKEALCMDLNGDGKLTIEDAFVIASYFGAVRGMSAWNPRVDIDASGCAGIDDIFLFCMLANIR